MGIMVHSMEFAVMHILSAIYPPPPPPEFLAKSRPSPGFVVNSGTLARFILIALVLLAAALPAYAATINVDATCTLAQAINEANGATSGTGSCEAGTDGSGTAGADTINIAANITLTADLPAVTSSITFNGNNKTINGGESHRAFVINTAGIAVTINNLTLAENQSPSNSSGGAINYSGGGGSASLTLNNVTISDSESWYSSVQRNGGGLFCFSSTLRINNSSFHNNRGNEGGAIDIGATCDVTITGSVFYNNSARLLGGAIVISKGAKATISNSSIYGNITGSTGGDGRGSAIYIIGGSGSSHRDIYLNHLTITGNQNSGSNDKRASHAAVQIVLSNAKVHLRNSIIYGNNTDATTPGVDCARTSATQTLLTDSASALETNTGNIIGDGNCGTPTGVFGSGGDPQLPASATSGYYALSSSSSAVDAAACISGLNQDQRGRRRPSGVRCDIGAYEYQYPPPPPPPAPPGSDFGGPGGGRSGSASRSGSQAEAMPTAVPVIRYSPEQSCQTLQPDIVVSKASIGTSCQRVEGSEIGHPDVIAAMPSLVVDLWGWVTPGTQVCFRADSGAIKFIDTTAIPRTVSDLPVFSEAGGLLCATIDGAGQVALVAGPSAPAPQQQAASAQGRMLSGCMVTLQYSLNFRDAPDGEKIGALRSQIKLTALERTDGWFKVDYHGEQGWISAAYVEPEGDCG